MKPTLAFRACLLGALVLTGQLAQAQTTYYWDSNNGTAGFGTANGTWAAPTTGTATAGWSTNILGTTVVNGNSVTTTSLDDLFFGTAANAYAGTITVSSGMFANSINFGGSGAVILSAGSITLGNGTADQGGINKTGTGAVTIGSAITLNNAQTWSNSNATGALTINGAVNTNGHTLTFSDAGATINFGASTTGVISGSGGVTVSGGRVNLVGASVPAHTYSGETRVNGGVLMYSAATFNANSNYVLNGGLFESYWNTGLTLAQGSNANQIRIIGGESGFSLNGATTQTVNIGAVTWGSSTFNPTKFVLQSQYSQTTSGLTFSSAINLNGADRTILANSGASGTATSTISGNITNGTGTAGIIKEGAGQLILTGTGNTYNGTTAVSAGILTASNTGALPGWNSSGNISVASGAVLGVRGGASWTQANIDTLIGNVAWADSTSALGFDTTSANFTYASTLNGAYSVIKYGTSNTLTLNSDLSGLGGRLILAAGTIARTAGGDLVTTSIEAQSGTISANIGGTTAVTKTTAGAITLSGANTYSGGFTLNAGSVTMTASGTYAGFGTGVVTINGGQFGNSASTSQTFNNDMVWNAKFSISQSSSPIFNGDITLGGNSGITPGTTTRAISATFNGNIDETGGSRSLDFTGVGSIVHTLTFNGQNTFTGNIVGHANTDLVIGGSGYLGGGNYAGNITGRALAYNSSATQILSGTNSLGSTTTVTAGAIIATKAASLSGYTTANRIIFNGGTVGVQVGGSGWTTTQVNTLLTNATKTSGALGIDTTNGDLTQWTAFTTTNLGSALGLHKLGSNKLILDQTNSYTGATTVSGGSLAVNGSLTATSSVTVSTGATLQGSGTINSSVTIQNGATLATGNSIESLGTGTLNLNTGSTFAYEIDKSVDISVGGDLTYVTGDLNIAAGAILTLTELDTLSSGAWTVGDSLTLISYTGVWNNGLLTYLGGTLEDGDTFTFSGATWEFDYNNLVEGMNYTGDSPDGEFYVTMTVIPEPATALLGCLGLLLILRRRR